MSSRLLIDEQPLLIIPSLAELIGLNEAVILQQIHYWIEINRKANKNFQEGRYWTYNSMKNWHENHFRFWSYNTVQRTFTKLENNGYLISGNFNKQKFDQTKWYTINYEALESLGLPTISNWGNEESQFGAIKNPSLGQTIPENITENNLSENIPRDISPYNSNIHLISSEKNPIENLPKIGETKNDEIREEVLSNSENTFEEQKNISFKDKNISDTQGKTKSKKKKAYEEWRENVKGSGNTTSDQGKRYTEPATPRYSLQETEEIIKENISYETILADLPFSKEFLDEIVDVITSTVVLEYRSNVIIMGNEEIPADLAKSVFLKLTMPDIKYFLESFANQKNPIVKIKPYIRKSLFNNYRTLNHKWQNYSNVVDNQDFQEDSIKKQERENWENSIYENSVYSKEDEQHGTEQWLEWAKNEIKRLGLGQSAEAE